MADESFEFVGGENNFIKKEFAWKTNKVHVYTTHDVFRIETDGHVSLQAALTAQKSGDAMRLFPLTTASTNFFVPSFQSYTAGGQRRKSGFLVVSAFNDTCVYASHLRKDDIVADPLIFNCIQEHETIQRFTPEAQGDYTGARITSNRPISVIAGHECATIPFRVRYCDMLMEAVPPVSEWGTEFIVGPILGRKYLEAGYLLRVVSGYDYTEIEIGSYYGLNVTHQLNSGRYVTSETKHSHDIVTVSCSKPCMVIQYNTGSRTVARDEYPTGPFMMLITPNDHFTNSMTFSTLFDLDVNNQKRTMQNYLTVVVPNDAREEVVLGNQTVSLLGDITWVVGVHGGYSITSFHIQHGDYQLYHPDTSVNIMGYLYAHGSENDGQIAYGFAVGYKLFGIPSDIHWKSGISECAEELQLLETNYSDVTCPDYQLLRDVYPEECKMRGCQLNATSLAYADWICRLYFCKDGHALKTSSINWSIYVAIPRFGNETVETNTDMQITFNDTASNMTSETITHTQMFPSDEPLETNTYPQTVNTVPSPATSVPGWALPVACVGCVVLTSVIVGMVAWKRKTNPQLHQAHPEN